MLRTSRLPAIAIMVALFVGGLLVSPLNLYIFLVFDSIERFGEPFGFIDRNGRVVNDLRSFNQTSYDHSYFSGFSDGLCMAAITCEDEIIGFRRDKYAYLRADGSFLANNATFYGAGDFAEGLAAVDVKKRSFSPIERDMRHHFDGDWSFIDRTGVRKFGSYGLVRDFSQGLAAVRPKDSLYWQFVDRNGTTKIKGPYRSVSSFAQNRAAVCINDKWGLIDSSGKVILAPVHDKEIRPFHEGLAAVVVPKDNRIDYLNTDGKIQFSLARPFPEPINFRSWERGESKFVENSADANHFGLPVDLNCDVSEGLVVIEKNGKFGYADVSGRTIVAPRFDYCWPFVEGRARVFQRVAVKGHFGFIDRTGKEVVPCKYVEAHDFSEGFAVVAVHDGDHSEYIDYSGRNVFGKTFPQAKSFHEGRAFVGRPQLCL
ncbi:MAG: WG repeat-containing protein [Candidatus Obscuribacterales bacterium]